MGRYRKVDPRIWNDEKFRTFSDDGQLAVIFVMTHPAMTCLGAMRATLEGLAAEKGWPVKRLREALVPAIAAGMVEYNARAAYIGLRRFLKYNKPEGPNSVIKAWLEALDLIPECPERRVLVARCREYLEARSDEFREKIPQAIWDAFADGIAHGIRDDIHDAIGDASPIQEQEQEQKQEPEQEQEPEGGEDTVRTLRGARGRDPSPNGFDALWAAHPGPKGPKAEALKVYREVKSPPEAVEAMRTQVAYKAACDRRGVFCAQFPHLHRWLKKRRWEDELPPLPESTAERLLREAREEQQTIEGEVVR